MSKESSEAFKRVSATLLAMGQTRLELAGLELTQARKSAIHSVVYSVLLALTLALASVALSALVVYLAWPTHTGFALMGCAIFYIGLAWVFWVKLKRASNAERPLFEATVAELGRDREAILKSISDQP
ncbi:phage holin family protein [Limnobacter sp.]|uniref:phage holin family protein n=1 Tax=Limnobacter sp. TaxID=2003368 RepID=UPI00258E4196|nr:phage holin family protein [Limnobacter sp.]